MERIGETFAWGELLLGLLEQGDWTIYRRPAFAGDGVLLIATHPALAFDVRAEGASVAEAAAPLFCSALQLKPGSGGEQLALPV